LTRWQNIWKQGQTGTNFADYRFASRLPISSITTKRKSQEEKSLWLGKQNLP
jgi:hypothetical protein